MLIKIIVADSSCPKGKEFLEVETPTPLGEIVSNLVRRNVLGVLGVETPFYAMQLQTQEKSELHQEFLPLVQLFIEGDSIVVIPALRYINFDLKEIANITTQLKDLIEIYG